MKIRIKGRLQATTHLYWTDVAQSPVFQLVSQILFGPRVSCDIAYSIPFFVIKPWSTSGVSFFEPVSLQYYPQKEGGAIQLVICWKELLHEPVYAGRLSWKGC